MSSSAQEATSLPQVIVEKLKEKLDEIEEESRERWECVDDIHPDVNHHMTRSHARKRWASRSSIEQALIQLKVDAKDYGDDDLPVRVADFLIQRRDLTEEYIKPEPKTTLVDRAYSSFLSSSSNYRANLYQKKDSKSKKRTLRRIIVCMSNSDVAGSYTAYRSRRRRRRRTGQSLPPTPMREPIVDVPTPGACTKGRRVEKKKKEKKEKRQHKPKRTPPTPRKPASPRRQVSSVTTQEESPPSPPIVETRQPSQVVVPSSSDDVLHVQTGRDEPLSFEYRGDTKIEALKMSIAVELDVSPSSVHLEVYRTSYIDNKDRFTLLECNIGPGA